MTYIVNLMDELDHHIKRNDVYEMIDVYMDGDNAQKFIDSQSDPTWYHVKEREVKM